MNDAARIPLRARDGSIRAYALVDAADAAWLNQWRWSLCAGYASRKESRTLRPGLQPRTLLMHRELLGLTRGDGFEGDHVNGDKLDNRRSNLRKATKAENRQNVRSRRGSTSRHRGVCWDRKRRLWRASVQLDYRTHILGLFADEDEAARVAAAFRAEHMPFAQEAAA